jgi:hypothetical protein
MKKFLCLTCFIAVGTVMAQADPTTPTMTICPSVAPNAYGSPSWSEYVSNAIAGLSTGTCTNVGGDRTTDPTAYNAVSTFSPGDVMVASFPLWDGLIDPTGAVSGEDGNRVTFGLIINGNGSQFSLSELSFVLSSSDPYNVLTDVDNYYEPSPSDPSNEYSLAHVGILANGSEITSGPSDQLVSELLLVGVGNGVWPGDAEDLADYIDYVANYMPSISITYTLTDPNFVVTASDTIDQAQTPEPATLSLMALGLASAMIARRKQARRSQVN